MKTPNWIKKFVDSIMIVLAAILTIVLVLCIYQPKISHTVNQNATITSLDAAMINIDWVIKYKSNIFFSRERNVHIEGSIKTFIWSRLNNITTKREAYQIYKMGIDSLQLLLNNDEQIKKLNLIEVRVNINNIRYDLEIMKKLIKIDSLKNQNIKQIPL